ncbi:MAG: hypothetical protein IAF58_17810 [Leptolyngbya sp.]|nr:hypothetical protein [Candidatus Melainabacteria bacterium]
MTANPNVYQFSGDEGVRRQNNQVSDGRDNYQFTGDNSDGASLSQQCWEIPGQNGKKCAHQGFPQDGQGFPIIYNNGGTVNIYMNGDGGQQRDYRQPTNYYDGQKLQDQLSGRWDNYRPNDNFDRTQMLREQMMQQGRMLEDQIRGQARQYDLQRSSYNRQHDQCAYQRPGQYSDFNTGRDYYDDLGRVGPRLPDYVNDDCFGTGRQRNRFPLNVRVNIGDNGRSGLQFQLGNNRFDRNDRYNDRYNDYAYNDYDRYNNGRYNNNGRFNQGGNFVHGGPDGFSMANLGGLNTGDRNLDTVLQVAGIALAYDQSNKYAKAYGQHLQPRRAPSYYS